MTTILRKLSANGITGNAKDQGFKNITEKTFIGRFMGVARSTSTDKSQYGDFIKFAGDFRAYNQYGELFAAPVMYLPGPIDEILAQAVKELAVGSNGVEFMFDIFVVPDAGSKRGYQYRSETVEEAKPSAPLAALEARSALKPAPFKAKPEAGQLALENAPAEAPAAAPAEPEPETASAEPAKAKSGKKYFGPRLI